MKAEVQSIALAMIESIPGDRNKPVHTAPKLGGSTFKQPKWGASLGNSSVYVSKLPRMLHEGNLRGCFAGKLLYGCFAKLPYGGAFLRNSSMGASWSSVGCFMKFL